MNAADPSSKTRLTVLEGHTATVRTCVISADNAAALTTSDDGTARYWHLSGGRDLVLRHGSPVADGAANAGAAAALGLRQIMARGFGGYGRPDSTSVCRGARHSCRHAEAGQDFAI